MTPDRPGLWTFRPYPWTGKQTERIAVDFEIQGDMLVPVVKSPRWPSTLKEMESLGRWEGPPVAFV